MYNKQMEKVYVVLLSLSFDAYTIKQKCDQTLEKRKSFSEVHKDSINYI